MTKPSETNISKRADVLRASLAKVQGQVRETSEVVEAQRQTASANASARSQWNAAMGTVMTRSADVCNDMLSTRDADPWSTAFAYLVNYCLANIGVARSTDRNEVQAAMLANLARMADELYEAFPSGKRVVTDWRLAIAEMRKLYSVAGPTTLGEVHPFAGTLARQLAILRNRGYPMAGLTEFYAPSDHGLHVIRP